VRVYIYEPGSPCEPFDFDTTDQLTDHLDALPLEHADAVDLLDHLAAHDYAYVFVDPFAEEVRGEARVRWTATYGEAVDDWEQRRLDI
jgi:hypothetical protein